MPLGLPQAPLNGLRKNMRTKSQLQQYVADSVKSKKQNIDVYIQQQQDLIDTLRKENEALRQRWADAGSKPRPLFFFSFLFSILAVLIVVICLAIFL
jgi:hypothetical protein